MQGYGRDPKEPGGMKRNDSTWVWLLSITLAAMVISACTSTIRTKAPERAAASWDGTNQHSGFIGWAPDGRGIITFHARDRYNALVKRYGKRFPVPLKCDGGMQRDLDGTWLIEAEALVNFQQMQRWWRSEQ